MNVTMASTRKDRSRMANAGVDTGANMLGVETASVTAIRWTIIAVETPAVSGPSQGAEKHGGMAPNVLELTLLVWLGALGAGIVGALTGLGGGVVIVPMLTLLFKVDMRYVIGAALVSVIALLRRSRGLRPRGLLERAGRHIPGGGDDLGRARRRIPGGPDPHVSAGCGLRALPAVLGVPDHARPSGNGP